MYEEQRHSRRDVKHKKNAPSAWVKMWPEYPFHHFPAVVAVVCASVCGEESGGGREAMGCFIKLQAQPSGCVRLNEASSGAGTDKKRRAAVRACDECELMCMRAMDFRDRDVP